MKSFKDSVGKQRAPVASTCRQWDTATPAPAPAPAQPKPVFLSDGSLQKSLGEAPSRSWTKAQLKDWFQRNDGQKKLFQQQFGGGVRGSFFKPDSQVV